MNDQFHYHNGTLYCEEVPVDELAERFGTPLWVYSKAHLKSRYSELKQAFAELDPLLCYSVKANGTLGVLRVMHELGSGFDVVSGGELFRVLKIGGDPRKTVFAGVGKTDEEIRYALEAGILMFDVESEPELDAISSIAAELETVGPVALRLNPDIDAHTHEKTTTGKRGNKFGMAIGRVSQLAERVAGDPHLELKGIHMHLGSPILSPDPYARAARSAADVVAQLKQAGHPVEWINLGGGFGVSYRHNEGPPASVYAEAIVPTLRETGCRLALEPGRFIAGNAGILLSRVIFVKREWDKTFVIQDAAMNDLVRPAMYDAFHRIWPVTTSCEPPADAETAPNGCVVVDVVGPVCESGDCLAKNRALPPVARGDLLATFTAGAYGSVMSSNYNARPRAAEVLVDGREVRLLRRRETWEDLVAWESEAEESALPRHA